MSAGKSEQHPRRDRGKCGAERGDQEGESSCAVCKGSTGTGREKRAATGRESSRGPGGSIRKPCKSFPSGPTPEGLHL